MRPFLRHCGRFYGKPCGMNDPDLEPLSRHRKIALSFSGGKDSLACVYLMRAHLHRITLYHLDTGDLLPEVVEIVEHVKAFAPAFVHVRSDVAGWIAEHGLPSDLVAHSAHPIGRMMGEHKVKVVSRYDCCGENLMRPIYERMRDDGNTLLIRGTKACDMQKLPATSGDDTDGMEIFYPLLSWSHANVMSYLRNVGAPICRVYEHQPNAPECARCPAWWSEGRAAYLRQYHPALFADYRTRLHAVAAEIHKPLQHLRREMTDCTKP